MASFEWPPSGGGGGGGVTIYATLADFPASAPVGTLAVAADTGIVYEFFGGMWVPVATTTPGTVTSVALSAPSSILSVGGSPVTTSGTLALTLATQTANTVWAGPTSGAAATPTFRALGLSDLPAQASDTLLGNNTVGSATPTALTVAQVNLILPTFTSTLNGLAPLSGGGTTNFLRADGGWDAPAGSTPTAPTSIGALDAQSENANGLALVSNVLSAQSADGTHPGMVNITTQTFAGQKTFSTGLTGTLTGAASLNVLTSALGTLSETTSSVLTLGNWTDATVGSPTITVKQAGASQSGYLSSTDWNTFNGKGAGSVTSVAASVPSFLSIGGSPITTSGTLAISYSGTALPILNGGTGVTSVTTAPTATSFAGWDANLNLSANNMIEGYATTATAAGTTTLTVASAEQQFFTGTTTQTVKLPVTSTLVSGMRYQIYNQSTGNVTVQSSGGTTLQVLAGGTSILIICIGSGHTDTTDWYWNYVNNGSTAYAQASTGPANTVAWATTAASYQDFTLSSGTPSITVRQANGITLTQAASNLPGITFTPSSSTAVYLITASISTETTTGIAGSYQLTDGTTVIAQSGSQDITGASLFANTTMSGIYVPGTLSPVTVKVQGYATGGTVSINNAANVGSLIEWTVIQISPSATAATSAQYGVIIPTGTTWTTPSNITTNTTFKITLVGAGGGGGGMNTANGRGSGGGGGAAVVLWAKGLSPSTGYTIQIGAGGAGGIGTGTAAISGTATTLAMDSVTYTAGGGTHGADTVATLGGAGGTATNTFASGFAIGGFNVPGQDGYASDAATASLASGGGGSSGMAFGSGGQAPVSGTGAAGTGFGGGGAGGVGTSATGGAGTNGYIFIEYNN